MILSIIIPTKNEEVFLPKLLESIHKQTFQDYEIIVADNKSKDKTPEIAKQYGCVLTQGGMPGSGRNLGAQISKGEILLFLDSDTELGNEFFLELLVEEFQDQKLDCAVPQVFLEGKFLDKLYYAFWNILVMIFQKISPFAGGWCIFARKEMHDKINGFDERIVLGEDSDYAKRIGKIGKFRMMKGSKVKVSPRRFAKEGHLKIIIQSIGVGIYWAIKGKDDKGNRFGYNFDIYKDEEKK
ncbi:MAG: glycosyltransferase [Candidatus Pacebacteria bacterium]|nr:glycosyltransferase [Candidatus Paceibacterota bacterium]